MFKASDLFRSEKSSLEDAYFLLKLQSGASIQASQTSLSLEGIQLIDHDQGRNSISLASISANDGNLTLKVLYNSVLDYLKSKKEYIAKEYWKHS